MSLFVSEDTPQAVAMALDANAEEFQQQRQERRARKRRAEEALAKCDRALAETHEKVKKKAAAELEETYRRVQDKCKKDPVVGMKMLFSSARSERFTKLYRCLQKMLDTRAKLVVEFGILTPREMNEAKRDTRGRMSLLRRGGVGHFKSNILSAMMRWFGDEELFAIELGEASIGVQRAVDRFQAQANYERAEKDMEKQKKVVLLARIKAAYAKARIKVCWTYGAPWQPLAGIDPLAIVDDQNYRLCEEELENGAVLVCMLDLFTKLPPDLVGYLWSFAFPCPIGVCRVWKP